MTKLDSRGFPVYSTYLGGSGDDSLATIAVDRRGSAYVAGSSKSRDYPQVLALQPSWWSEFPPSSPNSAPPANMVLTKLSPAGGIVYSTFATRDRDSPRAIAVTDDGTALLTTFGSGGPNQLLTVAHPLDGAAPAITGVTPATGPTDGDTPITVTGSGFLPGALVTVGGAAAHEIEVLSATQIRARTPAGAGVVSVAVVNPNSEPGSLPGAFTYAASGACSVALSQTAHRIAPPGAASPSPSHRRLQDARGPHAATLRGSRCRRHPVRAVRR